VRKLADIVFLVRPPLLAASATFFFAGAVSADRLNRGSYEVALRLGLGADLGLYLLVVALAFVVNQIFDVRSDTINKKNFILPAGAVSRRESLGFLALLGAATAGVAVARGPAMALLAAAGVVLGLAYSVPPVRLKARPIADLAANVAGFGWIGFLMGWLACADLGWEALARSSPYAIAMGAIFLNTTIPDEAGDRAAGDVTTCVAFGARPVAVAAAALVAAAFVAGIVADEIICALAALAALPAFAGVAARPEPSGSVVASQLAARLLFVFICIPAPLLAIVGVAAFAASKIYYAKRFGVDYPRLDGARLGRGK